MTTKIEIRSEHHQKDRKPIVSSNKAIISNDSLTIGGDLDIKVTDIKTRTTIEFSPLIKNQNQFEARGKTTIEPEKVTLHFFRSSLTIRVKNPIDNPEYIDTYKITKIPSN